MTSGYEARDEAVIANSIDYSTYLELQTVIPRLGEATTGQSGSGVAFVLRDIEGTQLRGLHVNTPSLGTKLVKSFEVLRHALNQRIVTRPELSWIEPSESETKAPSTESQKAKASSTESQSTLNDWSTIFLEASHNVPKVSKTTPVQFPPEVTTFIADEGLERPFDLALALIDRLIPSIVEVRGTLVSDPFTGDWVELYVIVDTNLEVLVSAEDDLLDEWIEKTSVEEGQRIRIDYKFAK